MSKSLIMAQINHYKGRLSDYRRELNEKEELYDALLEFSNQCNSRANSFDLSISKRKRKISTFDKYLSRVKSAVVYKNKMEDILIGDDFKNAILNLNNLMDSVQNKKNDTINRIRDLEDRIASLERKIADLQHEYDTYVEVEVKV